ncbi:MAG: DUF1295 domain-containing protein [Bacteriovoracaceae bacterium]|nr:DUF1295 domain-containing protein [Bacteriovoracaceae bacterium]
MPLLLQGFFLCYSIMLIAWFFFLKTGKAGVVDSFWAPTIATCALFYLFKQGEMSVKKYILLFLVLAWMLRLSSYLVKRISQLGDDARYQDMMSRWGQKIKFKMLGVYFFQASLAWTIALPFIKDLNSEWKLNHFFSILLALAGIVGEGVADHQLKIFKQKQQGICQIGLWKYSRHPNYFFEWLFWLGISLFWLNQERGYWALSSAFIMFILLRFFSGVKITEELSLKKRGQSYADYQKTTSVFFPWFSRRR